MAPAEIYQGGTLVNTIEGKNRHVGVYRGREVVVMDSDDVDHPGCMLCEDDMTIKKYFAPNHSVTLDHGEIVKSV